MIILDTNVVSELIVARPAPAVLARIKSCDSKRLFLTAITAAEMRYGCALLPAGRRRESLFSDIERMLKLFSGRILPFNEEASHFYADLAARSRRGGHAVSQFDLQIAAIALRHRATLVTRNIVDFELSQVALINPWEENLPD